MFKIKKQESGYGWWLFRKKGTAAEEWPTAEELWNDPNFQKEIKEVRQVFKKVSKNNQGA